MLFTKSLNPHLHYQHGGRVILILPKINRIKRRFIGTINYNKKIFYTSKRLSRYHVFKATNSVSVPYDLVYKKCRGFNYICLNLDGNKLWTSTLALKVYGEVMQFSKKGYEPQIFLGLGRWKLTIKQARLERKLMKEAAKL